MTHGKATLKENLLNTEGDVIVEQGATGIVTAYLPEQDIFAVMFSDDRWITFKETEEDLPELCRYQKEKDE